MSALSRIAAATLAAILAGALALAATPTLAQTRINLGTQARYGTTNWTATQAFFPNGTAAAPGIAWASDTDTGIYRATTNDISFSTGGLDSFRLNGSNVIAPVAGAFAFGSSGTATPDTFLRRDAANVLAQRNGTNAQTIRLYASFTDTGNYDRFNIQSDATNYILMSAAAGTGTGRNIYFGTGTAHFLTFRTNGTDKWTISSAGNLTAGTDNTYDIGAAGATRPRTGYFGTSVIAPTFTAATAVNSARYQSATNCSSSAAPAVCGSAAAGSVVIAAAGTTVTVNTTAVTANSQIFVQEDSSLGTKLGVTCNTTISRQYVVTARTAATSFVITASAAPVTDPACLSYFIVN